MARIPTYNSKFTPQPTFTKPQAVKGLVENIGAIANFANAIADEQAELKAYDKGFKQQTDNLTSFIASEDAYSITGAAYTKGARAAFISNFKTDAENELNQFAIDNQYEPEEYKKKFNIYKSKVLQNVPQTLLPDVTTYLDALGNRLQRNVTNNKLNYDKQIQAVDITNRFEILLPQLSQSIRTNGFDTNTSINTYSELLTAINGLEESKFNPVKINNLKLKLKDDVIESTIVNAFNIAEDKQAFISKVEKGEVTELLEDLNNTYKVIGFEFNTNLTTADSSKIASKLNTILRYDSINKKVDRQVFTEKFNNWYNTNLEGLDAGEVPSVDDAKNLLFDETQLKAFTKKIEIINAIAPDINGSRFGTLSESQNILKEAQAQYTSILQQSPSDERNEDLIIAQAKVDAISKHVKFKQDAINDGDAFKILSLQGIQYSFNSEQEITKTHELLKSNVGVNGSRLLLMPKSHLETYKEEFETAESQSTALAIVGKYKAQFGKYTNQFLRDSELSAGYRVVFDMIEKQPANAGTIWQSIKDKTQNETALKNSRDDFTNESKEFSEQFKDNFGDAFRGNEDLYNDIYAGAYALYLKNLATIGDNEKAIQNTINLFGNEGGIYQYVEINNQPVFIPPNVNGAQIKNNVEDMLNNPHRYNITSSANFTLQDIVENKDEYTVVIEGGTAKLIQNSNILFAAEIYQKLPSGSKQFVYTDVMINTDDGYQTETSMLDFDETWSFDEPKNLNSKIKKQIKKTKIIKGGATNVFGVEGFVQDRTVDTSTFEKVTQLKEIVYENVADKDGMPYADVFSGDIGVSTRDMQNLNAISLYIKDGDIEPYILDYLSTFDYLARLKNQQVQNEVIKQWKNKTLRVRTTANVESAVMTPLQSLTDIVRSIKITPTESAESAYASSIDIIP